MQQGRYSTQFRRMVDVGRRVQREKDEKLAQQKLDMGMAVSQEMAQEDEQSVDGLVANVSEKLIDLTRRLHFVEAEQRKEQLQLQLAKHQQGINELKARLDLNFILVRSNRESLQPAHHLHLTLGRSAEVRRTLKEVYSNRSTSMHETQQLNMPKLDSSKALLIQEDKSPFLTYHSIKKLNNNNSLHPNTRQSQRNNQSLELRAKNTTKSFLPKITSDFLQQFFLQLSGSKLDNFSNARVYRATLRQYLLKRYPEKLVDRLLNFFEVANQYDFQQFKELRVTNKSHSFDQGIDGATPAFLLELLVLLLLRLERGPPYLQYRFVPSAHHPRSRHVRRKRVYRLGRYADPPVRQDKVERLHPVFWPDPLVAALRLHEADQPLTLPAQKSTQEQLRKTPCRCQAQHHLPQQLRSD